MEKQIIIFLNLLFQFKSWTKMSSIHDTEHVDFTPAVGVRNCRHILQVAVAGSPYWSLLHQQGCFPLLLCKSSLYWNISLPVSQQGKDTSDTGFQIPLYCKIKRFLWWCWAVRAMWTPLAYCSYEIKCMFTYRSPASHWHLMYP